MFEELFHDRLTKLRVSKGVSQREMSLSMGQSEGYITKMESTDALPSMRTFFYICDYLGVAPKEFFDDEIKHPEIIAEIVERLNRLDSDQLLNILQMITYIAR